MQDAGTFLLGVGAQKTGTTWLHGYLSCFPEVDFGAFKEYHIWDAILTDIFPKLRITEGALVAARRRGDLRQKQLRYAMQNVPGFYEFYFRRLLDTKCRITGDITPSYSSLSAEAYADVRRRMESVGAKVKVVFIMRDPFERIWSEVRMYQKKRLRKGFAREDMPSNEAHLLSMYAARATVARTDYCRTIESLEQAFDPGQIMYLIYEDMFRRESLDQIADFFGVGVDERFLEERLNASPKEQGIHPATRRLVMDHYAHIYDFCAERFPSTRELWGQAAMA